MTTTDHTLVAPTADQLTELRAAVQAAEDAQIDHTDLVPVAPPAPKTAVNKNKPELPAYALSMLGVLAITGLTWTGHPVPDVLNLVTVGAIGIAGAVTNPLGAPK